MNAQLLSIHTMPPPASPLSPLATIQEMYRRFAAGDTEAIRQLVAPDVRWNMMPGFPGGGRYVGVDEVFAWVFPYFRQHWTDWQAHTTRLVETAIGVFVIGYYTGIYPATGRRVRADFAAEYQVQDGKITEYNQYTDTLLIAQAMAAAPATG